MAKAKETQSVSKSMRGQNVGRNGGNVNYRYGDVVLQISWSPTGRVQRKYVRVKEAVV